MHKKNKKEKEKVEELILPQTEEKKEISNKKIHFFWRIFFIILGCFLGVLIIGFSTIFIYNNVYKNKIYPGVYLGDYSLGGLTKEGVKDFIEQVSDRLNKENIIYQIKTEEGKDREILISSILNEGDSLIEIISLSIDKNVDDLMVAGRDKTSWQRFFSPILLRFYPYQVLATVNIDENNFQELFLDQADNLETLPNNAKIKISSIDPLEYSFISEQSGRVFNFENIITQTKQRLSLLNFSAIDISLESVEPSIKQNQLINIDERLKQIFSFGDIELTYLEPESTDLKTDKIGLKEIQEAIIPYLNKDGQIWFDLEKEILEEYLEQYKIILNKVAEESKFVMGEGKLKEFEIGRSGELFNIEKTIESISALMKTRNIGNEGATSSVSLIVDSVEPKLKLADVNNLGITAILGSGTSTFYDSHTNRIKNITRATELLNGTIIAPGEEFSTIRYTGPYTLENGYLAEEVIKGNQIKKEIGGGMCQISTTLFRMAMNSAMPITERTNHSLVVNYYADPVNGNPGTDASIYDPMLDFKFLNDTGHYLLLEAKIDFKKQMITFTLWGKPDGRSGSYSRPLVSRWIPAGEPQYIYTTNLKPGAQTCQNAFRGAVASFTYTRYTKEGEKIDRVFDSYYRPLAKICMVGIDDKGCIDENNCPLAPKESNENKQNETTAESKEEVSPNLNEKQIGNLENKTEIEEYFEKQEENIKEEVI